jgi:hypothetical protein
MRSLAGNPTLLRHGWLAAVLVFGLLYSSRILFLSYSVWRGVQQLSALPINNETLDLTQTGSVLHSLNQDLNSLSLEAWPLTQSLRLCAFIPGLGSDLASLGHLLSIAANAAYAADTAWQTVSPVLDAAASQPKLPVLFTSIQTQRTNLTSAQRSVRDAIQLRADLPPDLTAGLQTRLDQLDRYLPILDHALTLLLALPDILGAEQPRTYLVLVQNSDELRASGGFISSVGILRVSQGNLELRFENSYAIDDYASRPYPPPPAPLHIYMGADLWLFRDANWSASFPASARSAAALFALGQNEPVAGVLALDQTAVRYLLAATGPLTLSGGTTVSSDTIVDLFRAEWQPEPSDFSPQANRQQPDLVRDLGQTLLERGLTEPQSLNPGQLVAAVGQALSEKHLLIFMGNSAVNAIARSEDWDGAIVPGYQDYLYVIDSNVGFNKVNAIAQRSLRYSVDLTVPEKPVAQLALQYTIPGSDSVECRQIDSTYGSRDYVYETQKCYWNYLRVYAPQGSTLIESKALPTPADWLWNRRFDPGWAHQAASEFGAVEFNQFFVVPYGQSLSAHLTYQLPATVIHYEIDRFTYCLELMKQPGTDTTPTDLTVIFPPGSQYLAADPPPTLVADSVISFEALPVRSDQTVCATFSRP